YCLQAIGKYDEAVGFYQKAVRADPKRVSAYINHAAVLHRHFKQLDKALATVEDAARANPQSGMAHAARAEFLRLAGRVKEAVEAVRLADQFPPDNDRDRQRVLAVAADVEQSAGNYAAARKLLETGYKTYPKNPQFARSLASQLLYDGRADRAIAILRESRAVNPQDADVLTLLADLLAQDGQVAPLDDALRDLTEMNAPADRVQYVQARLLIRRGRWADAAGVLDRLRSVALRTPSLFRQANLLLAQCYEQLGDAAGELDAYRRLLDDDPNAGTVRLDYARALARAGKADEALTQFLSVVPRAEVSSRAVAEAARALTESARSDAKAWAPLEKAIDALRADPTNPNPVLARAYLDLARYRAADSLPAVETLLRTKPTVVALHVARVALAEQVNGLDSALKVLAEANALVGDQPDLRIARTRLLAARLEPAYADGLADMARGVERFGAEDRARIVRELIAAFRSLGDSAAVGLHLDLLAQLRPDDLSARAALFARALRAGDDARRNAVRRDVEAIEGPDGATAHLLDAQQILWPAKPGDAAALNRAEEQLIAAGRGRPHDPVVEFLRGRVAELAGRSPEALRHYQAAFAAGLADRPVEEVFANVRGKSGAAPVVILRDQLPLAARLRPDRHRSLIVTVLPLYDAAGLELLAGRLAAAAPPNDAVQQVWLGRLFARLKLDRPAEEAFRRAATGAPQSPEGWLALVAFHAARRDAASTGAAAAAVREKMPPIEAHLVVGRALELARQPDAAQKEYESAAALNPNDTRPLTLLAKLAMARGRADEACKWLEQIVGLSSPTAAEDRAWARRTLAAQIVLAPSAATLQRALALLDANKVNDKLGDDDVRVRVLVLAAQRSGPVPGSTLTGRREAIRTLEELRKQGTGRSADDLMLLTRLYRAEGDEAAARRVRDQIAAEYPAHFGAAVFLAREALRDHDLPACERLLPALRRLGPGQFDGIAVEFQYRVLAGSPDVGRRLLDDYVAAGPTPEAKAARGVRCGHLIYDFLQAHPADDRDAAVADLRQAAARFLRPHAERDPQAFQRLVTLLAVLPDGTNPAIALAERGKRVFGPEVAAAAYVQILRHGRPGPTDAQKERMKRFILDEREKAPRSTPLQLTWAEFLQLNGENAAAVAVYRDVLSREPDNVLALNNLAWTLSLDRRDEAKVKESLAHIQRAIDLAGPLDELLDTRARILFESGQPEAGLRDMCEAVNEAPSANRLKDYAIMLRKAGKAAEAERALAEARRFGLGAH
ncbi:MAG TPA: tetratricopeptide repeat protein, partial [Gemmataceae bacterium]